MKIENVKLSQIKANKSNPRVIKDHKFHKLVKSLLVLPKMLELRPIVVSIDMTILGGNMRFRALQHIAKLPEDERIKILESSNDYNIKKDSEKEKLKAYWNVFCDSPIIPIVKANELSDEEQKEFIIKDNASFGEWDFDCLANEWDVEDLNDWGVDIKWAAVDFGMTEEKSEVAPHIEHSNNNQSDNLVGNLPSELQGVNLRPEELPKICGADEVLKQRIIIVFEEKDKVELERLLGIELNKVVYEFSELKNG